MSLVDARSAEQLGGKIAVKAMVNSGQCTQQYVPIVALNARYLSNLGKTDRFIAAPVIQK